MSSRLANGESFNYVSSYMVIEIIQTRVNVKAVINTMKYEWLFIPTQLSVQGQWWSNLSTHLLQIEQCRDLGVRTISQSGQSWTGSMSCKRFRKSMSLGFLMKPGSLTCVKYQYIKAIANPDMVTIIYASWFHNGNKYNVKIRIGTKQSIKKRITNYFDRFTFLIGLESIRQSKVLRRCCKNVNNSCFNTSLLMSLTKSIGNF